jgi:hypothetical protein
MKPPTPYLLVGMILGIFAVWALPLAATAEEAKSEDKVEDKNTIPADLMDDQRMVEAETNGFAVPSIPKVFDALQFLMPLPLAEMERKLPARMPLERTDLAIELGFLIAEGFLMVQAGELDKLGGLAGDLTRYGKALGVGDRVNRRAASLLDIAKNKNVPQLMKELAAMQVHVEAELVTLKDSDLAHLITLGGWIRGLEVCVAAMDRQFSQERARKVMREEIVDYYAKAVAGMGPQISQRPKFIEMRDILARLRDDMVLQEGHDPTKAQISGIRKQAAKLASLALRRQP